MKLSDFTTLTDAKAYFEDSYITISAAMSTQFFGVTGMLDALESNTTNPTLVQLDINLPQTSVGALCRTVLASAKTTGFSCDPLTEGGLLNRAGAAVLVAQGVFLQNLVDAFFDKGFIRSYPFINATKHDFQAAKGTITRVTKQAVKGWLKITTTVDCEKHKPQIYVNIQGVIRRVAGFDPVELAGDYLTQVPSGYSDYFVDNAYGVVG